MSAQREISREGGVRAAGGAGRRAPEHGGRGFGGTPSAPFLAAGTRPFPSRFGPARLPPPSAPRSLPPSSQGLPPSSDRRVGRGWSCASRALGLTWTTLIPVPRLVSPKNFSEVRGSLGHPHGTRAQVPSPLDTSPPVPAGWGLSASRLGMEASAARSSGPCERNGSPGELCTQVAAARVFRCGIGDLGATGRAARVRPASLSLSSFPGVGVLGVHRRGTSCELGGWDAQPRRGRGDRCPAATPRPDAAPPPPSRVFPCRASVGQRARSALSPAHSRSPGRRRRRRRETGVAA